jgi:hypothetical protein
MRGPVLLVLLTALAPVARAADEPRPERYELGGTPVLTGDSDIGIGFGALVSLARFRPGFYPYRWRAEILAMMTVKDAPDGGAELPYHDYHLKLDLPGLAGGGLRLQWGETFLLRGDVAWSPDARPVGIYVDVNHVF